MSEFDVSIPIATYGILRKASMARQLVEEFKLDAVEFIPDKIKGYVPYHSGGINFMFRVNQRLKDKFPDADFIVPITLLHFKGTNTNLNSLYEYLDALESGYERIELLTEKGTAAYLYVSRWEMKTLTKYVNVYGRGLVVYPDTILDHRYFVAKNPDYSNLQITDYRNATTMDVSQGEEEEE